MDLITCPQPTCDLPAEIFDRVLIASTDLPIEHARIACLHGHRFLMPLQLPPPSVRSVENRSAMAASAAAPRSGKQPADRGAGK